MREFEDPVSTSARGANGPIRESQVCVCLQTCCVLRLFKSLPHALVQWPIVGKHPDARTELHLCSGALKRKQRTH